MNDEKPRQEAHHTISGVVRWLGRAALALSITTSILAQTTPATLQTWKDGEAQVGLAAQSETDPAKQLELLKTWEQQYPSSEFMNQRTLMTASALLNIVGAAFAKTDAAGMEAGQKAAHQLIDHFGVYFAAPVKPVATSETQWSAIQKTAEMQSHALLGQYAIAKKDDATAEAEYKLVLTVEPTQALASYQVGGAILRQMAKSPEVDPARYSEALYDLARSVTVTGPNALPPAGLTAALNLLKKHYANYHGDASGMEDLMRQVAESAVVPSGFHIQSKVDLEAIKEKNHEEWARQHPDLAFWEAIRTQLEQQGDSFFEAHLKGVGFPPPAGDAYAGPAMFSGTVVSANAKLILVNVQNVAGDAALKIGEDAKVSLKGEIPAGTAIRFRGVVDSWTKAPSYVLTLEIQEPKTDITGLPEGVSFVADAVVKKPVTVHKPAPKAGTKATK